MSTRIFSLLPILFIVGCGDSAPTNGPAPPSLAVTAKGDPVAGPPPKTLCAVGGVKEFERLCDRDIVDGLLTIRHPDGGFRRFEIVSDGRGLIAADGAEPASVATVGTAMIEVSIAGDRYRLPATVER